MSRIHDALRKAGLETDQSGISKASQVAATGIGVADLGGPRLLDEGIAKPEEDGGSGPFGRDHLSGDEGRLSDLSRQGQEEVARMVQRVFTFPNSCSPRLVVFASVEGTGSSDICFRAGEALAMQTSSSVCLVDANLRAPLLHRFCGINQFPGLADAVIKTKPIKDFARRVAGGNLWLMPAGEAPRLFASDRLCSRILELKEEFDFVLIDAPAAASNGDAVLLGQMSDGVILVVEANSTRRETARIAKETFKTAKVKLLGAILNNRTFPIPELLYRKL
ncbi:MAG: CpsD/CapB family tyrosine-protein kinase [Bryobacteraceae bacterium]